MVRTRDFSYDRGSTIVSVVVRRHGAAWLRAAFGAGQIMVVVDRKGTILHRAEDASAVGAFAGLDLTNADFDRASLAGADFTGATLNRASFAGADLSGAELCAVVMEDANLTGARLVGARLRRANLYWLMAVDADFTDADLAGAAMKGAALQNATFFGADLRGACFEPDSLGSGTDLRGADLRGAATEGASFIGARYDYGTHFSEGFEPTEHGMVLDGADDPVLASGEADPVLVEDWVGGDGG